MLVHHELCFGCGRTNLFGLLLEAERSDLDLVTGRCFIKQDHQGPERGTAHPGIVATALVEVMALAAGGEARPQTLSVSFDGVAPVGSFLALEARVQERDGTTVTLAAVARAENGDVAQARGTFSAG